MSITAKELSHLLNLSEAAVSMALNNKPGVSTKTRKRVIEAARNHGYDFTRISGSHPATGNIHVIVYRKHGAVVTETPFFSALLDGINEEYNSTRFHLNINYIYLSENIERQLQEILYSGCIGIILLATEMKEEDFKPFSNLPVPVVILDNYFPSVKRDCIQINNRQGAFTATNYLITQRKRQPGYLHSSYLIYNFEERKEGFMKAVKSSGMSSSNSIIHLLSPSMEGAYADMLGLLNQGENIADCYFADNDLIAAGAMRAFRERGYRLPEDIAIIGFDNMPMCAYLEPNLTTIDVPKQYMGKMAAHRLNTILEAKEFVPVKYEISTELVKRKSV